MPQPAQPAQAQPAQAQPAQEMQLLRRARLKVAGSVLAATLFVFPFRYAAADGRGAGAALGLLMGVAVLFLPLALHRVGKLAAETRTQSARLAWKIAVFAASGNIAQGVAFETLHVGVATTVIQMNLLFVAILGVVWLREALHAPALVGVFLAILGVLCMQAPTLAGQLHFGWGVLWALGAALSFSLVDVITRRDAHGADALLTNVMRVWVAAAIVALVPSAREQLAEMSPLEWAACGAAALLGPGLARQLLIDAARHLSAVESALIQQLRPLLVLPLGSLVFGVWPSGWEWAGCALILLGVVVPLRYKHSFR